MIKFIRFNILFAFCLIAIGLLVNQWLLGYLFSPKDGSIALGSKIFIWAFEIFCIISGLLVYFKGNTTEGRKWLFFAFLTAALIIITIEIGLHSAHFLIHLGDQEISDKRYLLAPYEGKKWAKDLFKEFNGLATDYVQFLQWDRKEYHGKYININSQGVRKTWNPEHFHGKVPDTIYVFGGSTLWGTGARDDYTIPSYLSKLFNNSDYNFVVYNYGETAYTFTQEIIHLILLLREGHKPNYVIFYDGANDVSSACQSGMAGTIFGAALTREKLKATEKQLFWDIVSSAFKNHCMSYREVRKILARFSQQQELQKIASRYSEKELELLSDDIIEYYIKSMELLDRVAQAYDFKYICFWQPVIVTEKKLIDGEPKLNDNALYKVYRCVNNSLMTKPLPHFFNISNALSERTGQYYIDFAHLSEDGNEVIATKIFQIFKKEFLQ